MKRKSICAFLLIFWVLLVCTIFTYRIEEWMTPWVEITTENSNRDTGEFYLPLDVLVYENDSPVLYEVVQGDGWESGSQVRPYSPANYAVLPGRVSISISSSYGYLHYSTKGFRNLDVVNVVSEPMERGADFWLAVSNQKMPELGDLPRTMRVEAKTENTLLLSVEGTRLPFMAGRAKSEIPFAEKAAFTDPQAEETVYSLGDTEQAVAALPRLALLLLFLLVPLILWGYSCFLTKEARKNRAFLLINGGLAAALLIGLPFFLSTIDLPSSLLPRINILEFGHYAEEFREIFTALNGLSAAGSQTAAAALQTASRSSLCFFAILLGGVLLAAALVAVEAILLKKRAAPKGRHARQ